MITTIIDWDGKQNVVVIMDGTQAIRVPLDEFIELPAVRYVMDLAVEQAGRRRPAKRQPAPRERSRKNHRQIDHPQERRP
jgi:hypothetical protein